MPLFILILLVVAGIILVGIVLYGIMGRRIRRHFIRKKTEKIRRTNPCYRCKSSRKYVCDGCYVKLRREKEAENELE